MKEMIMRGKVVETDIKIRSLNTRLGEVELKKPQIREFSFKTRVFDNYQRSENALILAIQQMVIDGISTEKVKKITERLSDDNKSPLKASEEEFPGAPHQRCMVHFYRKNGT